MDPKRWQHVKRILDDSLKKSPEELPAWLDEICGGDERLRHEVERLLAYEERLEAFSEASPGLKWRSGSESAIGRQVGPYQIQELLGRGGMGAVYRAERVEGFHQTVALKLIRDGIDTSQALDRFCREREILASLEHPHIAHLLDGATDEDGRPFFAMELVDGVAIDRYCDDHRLNVRQRIALVLPVGEALIYAHRNLVIHRDLKPANILVDREGTPKLLDFGIAKLMEPGVLIAEVTGRVMTPRFASPEQLLDAAVSTASDVYSLGVVVYHLLTGRLPCGLDTCSSSRVPYAVCEEQPEAPSAAVLETAEVLKDDEGLRLTPEAVAEARDCEPRHLAKALRGDLDAIVLKALRKEPELRYPSVERFVDDLRRHLDGHPVSARRGSFVYRAHRYVRRHRVRALMAAAMVLMALGFTVTLLWDLRRIEVERDRAEMERQRATRHAARAEHEAESARQVSEFLANMFKSADPRLAGRGADALSARDVLERGTERLQNGLAEQPEVRARLLTTIGEVYVSLGLFPEAEPLLREGLAMREQLFGPDSLEVAESLQGLGRFLAFARGPSEDLEPWFQRALEIRERHLAPDALELAETLRSLGIVYMMKHRYAPAREVLARALSIREHHLGPEHADVGAILQRLAHAESASGRFEAAIPLMERSVEISEHHLGPDHPRMVQILGQHARFYLDGGRPDEAEPRMERAIELAEQHLGADHQSTAESLQTLARIHLARGKFQEAKPLLRRALSVYESKGGDVRVQIAALCWLARASRELGELSEAEARLTQALELTRSAGLEIINVSRGFAQLRQAQGNTVEAERWMRQVLELIEKRQGADHSAVADVLDDYAPLLRDLGREQEAAQAEARARAIRGAPGPRSDI